jgi:imidazolonepropionase-like amidohydrolase
MITLFENARIFDGTAAELIEDATVVVEGAKIVEVGRSDTKFSDARVLDCRGHVLMPGLIDAHFHAYSPSLDIAATDKLPQPLLVSHAATILEGTLRRGFTSVRDAAGGDIGLALAIDAGLIKGPRFFFSGKAISQTGGHGDFRPGALVQSCACASYSGSISRVADGADNVRLAVREELRKGAHQVKLFLSGGLLSPSDPIWMPHFAEEEIRAAVHEAQTRRTYVMAHCHTDDAARRCIEYGVRSIEHGSQILPETAQLIAANDAFVVPTLSIINVLRMQGSSIGVSRSGVDKVADLFQGMLASIETCARAQVKLGFGTDLFDHKFHPRQGGEFTLRSEVNRPIDVLRSATSINAQLLQRSGEIGCIEAGAYADLIVLDGDPLTDLSLLAHPERNMPLVMKDGICIRNEL